MDYVCQQCRVNGYPDCHYEFHPAPPRPDDDRWRQAAEKAGR